MQRLDLNNFLILVFVRSLEEHKFDSGYLKYSFCYNMDSNQVPYS